jgi:hypothetical protein
VDGFAPAQREAAHARLGKGEVLVERLETLYGDRPIPVPDGLIHHWVGTVFIPHATLAQTLAFLQDYDNQYKYYSPNVQRSKLIRRSGNDFEISQRLRETKIITVTLDANYDVKYVLLNSHSAAAYSHSTRIAEVANAGKPDEFEKPPGNDSGFLWRLNSYWRFLQREGGVYIQLEAISLTRDIPPGLGWLIGPICYQHSARVAAIHSHAHARRARQNLHPLIRLRARLDSRSARCLARIDSLRARPYNQFRCAVPG